MNTPTPDFVSQIAASSQTVSTIEESNTASSLHLSQGLLSAAGFAAHSGSTVTGSTDLHSHLADPKSSATDPSKFLGGATVVSNHGSVLTEPPSQLPSSLAHDTKGLASALEASNGNAAASSHLQRVEAPLEEVEIGRALATAEELGFVEDLARWMEERLGSAVVSQWGVAPGSKPVANLWNELTSGESSLEDSRPPKRTTNVVSVKINNEKGDVLIEAYQEMSDGRRRERNRCLSEKMKPGEDVEEACLRGIFEELGPELGSRQRVVMVPESYTQEIEERESLSYPGLPTKFILHSMEAHIQQLPPTEFSTCEDESYQGESGDDPSKQRTVGCKRHFWRWVSESELAQLCKKL